MFATYTKGGEVDPRLVNHVRHKALIAEYKAGAEIERWHPIVGWIDSPNPHWVGQFEYRIKEEGNVSS
jgi:hypothetical protein